MKPALRSFILAGGTLCTAFALIALAAPEPSPQVPQRLGSTILDLAKFAAQTTPTGERRDLFDAPTLALDRFRCHVTTLKGGADSHKGHHHPHEEMLVVKEGVLEVTIDGKPHRAEAGAVVFLAYGAVHSVHNPGTEPASYYVFRWYTSGGRGSATTESPR